MKRTVSIILSVLMLVSVFAQLNLTVATAAEIAVEATSGDYSYKILDDGTIEITDYSGNETELKIPSAVGGYPVASIGSYAFSRCTSLTNITIPDSVTSLGDSVFLGCTGLTNITIPNRLTSIGNSTFEECTGLKGVTIGNNITSIGEYAFYKCTSLTSITIPDSVTNLGDYVFLGCTGLTEVNLPDSLTIIGSSTFNGCTSLTNVTIPKSVTIIEGRAFYNCTSLSNITIPDSVTNIGADAFAYCTGLTDITIPENITSIGADAFAYCTGLTTVNYNAVNCTAMGEYIPMVRCPAFNGCTALTTVNIGNEAESIPTYAFINNSGINNVIFGESVKSIGEQAFYACEGLTNIALPDSLINIDSYAFAACTGLESVTLGNSLTSINNSVFSGSTSLTNITIPESVTSIGDYAFYDCYALKNITLSELCEIVGQNAFSNCINMEKIVIKNPDCVIYDDSATLPTLTTVYGYTNSTAQQYAETYSRSFKDLNSVEIDVTLPEKLEYIKGEDFDSTGMVVTEKYNGESEEVTDYQVTGFTGEIGVNTITVNYYGKTYTFNVTVHNPADEWVVTKEPACTEKGVKSLYCTECENLIKTEEIPATGHLDSSVPEKKPTCTEYGHTAYTYCHACETYPLPPTEIEPTGHTYSSEVTTSATCTAEGFATYTCHCGDSYTEAIPKTAHNTVKDSKKATYFAKGYKNKVICKNCGTVIAKGTTVKKLKLDTPKVTVKGGKKKITVKYTKVTGSKGFEVKHKIGKKADTKVFNTKKTATKAIKKLTKGTYKVQVRVFVKQNGKTAYSSWTKVTKVKVK